MCFGSLPPANKFCGYTRTERKAPSFNILFIGKITFPFRIRHVKIGLHLNEITKSKCSKVAELNINVNKNTSRHSHVPKNFGLLLPNTEKEIKANAKRISTGWCVWAWVCLCFIFALSSCCCEQYPLFLLCMLIVALVYILIFYVCVYERM